MDQLYPDVPVQLISDLWPARLRVGIYQCDNGFGDRRAGTSSQTTQTLGTFSDANANGFQSWHWVPLMSNGQPAVVTLSGVQTLKVTAPPGPATGSLNAHFYMFVPFSAVTPFSISASVSAGTVSIKFPTQSGHSYTVYYSTSLNPASWQTLASGIAGDGTVKTVD